MFKEAAKSFEKKAGRVGVSDNFCNLLLDRLKLYGAFKSTENGGFVNGTIIKAKFQADYVITLCSLENKNNFIYLSDSDFAALLGNNCILIDEIVNRGESLLK